MNRKTLRVGDKVFTPNSPEWVEEIISVYTEDGHKYYNTRWFKSPVSSIIGQKEYAVRLSRSKRSPVYVEFYQNIGHPLTKIFK